MLQEFKQGKNNLPARFREYSMETPSTGAMKYLIKRGLAAILDHPFHNRPVLGFDSGKNCLVFPILDWLKPWEWSSIIGLHYVPYSGDKCFSEHSEVKEGFFYHPGIYRPGYDKPVIITESIFSALSVRYAFPEAHVISILSITQTDKLSQLIESNKQADFVLFFDNDDAGRKATKKANEILNGHCRNVDWSIAPEDHKDANDLLVAGYGETIRRMVETAKRKDNSQNSSSKSFVLAQEALPGIAGKFVELACRNSEANPAAVLVTFLVRFAVEVGTGPKMFVGDTIHYARIFAVVVGATSKARKGTSAKPIDRLFAGVNFPARRTPGPLSSGEGLIHAVRDPGDNLQKDFDQGVEDKRLYVIDEEFGGALACSKRKGNNLSTVIRSAWDDGDLDPLTKHSKISVKEAHIGIVTHITIHELKAKFSSTEYYSGFANRFLWVFSKRSQLVPLPEPMPEKELNELQEELETLVREAKKDQVINLDKEAETFWVKKYPELSDEHPGLVGAIINRGEAQVLRIAMIYCLLDGKNTISVSHLEAALAVWQYCVDSAYHIFGDREADDVSQKILDGLKKGPLDGTGMSRLFNNHLSKSELSEKIAHLKSVGKVIEEKDSSTGGRARVIYKLVD